MKYYAYATSFVDMYDAYPEVVGIYDSADEAQSYCDWENQRDDYNFYYVMPCIID